MRELRELQPPTYTRIAKIADVHVTTVREIASRENWPKLHVPKGTVMQVARIKDLLAEEDARARAEILEAMNDPDADLPELPPGDIGAFVIADMRAILVEAAHTGRIDKARVDTLWSMLRVAERSQVLQHAAEQQEEERSDDELADILTRVDQRIVELARDYAERLVAERNDAQAG
jgi:hypothetical protein